MNLPTSSTLLAPRGRLTCVALSLLTLLLLLYKFIIIGDGEWERLMRMGNIPKSASPPVTKQRWREIVELFGPKTINRGYGSHALVLLAAVTVTNETIVEFGCGYFSTPMLHNYCQKMHHGRRRILTADTNRKWLKQFQNYSSDFHEFREISATPDWSGIAENCGNFEYGVIFIDHAPGERRVVDLVRLQNCSKLVVLHDTEEPGYEYEPGLVYYKYAYDVGRMFGAGVMVLSNYNQSLVLQVQKLIWWWNLDHP